MEQIGRLSSGGGIHGSVQIIEKCWAEKGKKFTGIKWWLNVTVIFMVITIAWVFFRAPSLDVALMFVIKSFYGMMAPMEYIKQGYKFLLDMGGIVGIIQLIIMLIMLFVFDYKSLETDVIEDISNMSVLKRWGIYILVVFLILVLLPEKSGAGFIYMQF